MAMVDEIVVNFRAAPGGSSPGSTVPQCLLILVNGQGSQVASI